MNLMRPGKSTDTGNDLRIIAMTKSEIHQRHLARLAAKTHGHAKHSGLNTGGGAHKPPASRWPKDAKNWSAKQKQEYSAKLQKKHPTEDPEYEMPDGSE